MRKNVHSQLEPPIEAGENLQWEFNHDLTDEFNADELSTIWQPYHPMWLGRAPAFFREENVQVDANNNCLKLHAKCDRVEYVHNAARRSQLIHHNKSTCQRNSNLPIDQRKHLYRDWSSSFVRTHARQRYGYFEICCKLADSHISSAFWLAADERNADQPGSWWTEIDVFEFSTSTKHGRNQARIINSNLHVHRFGNDLNRPHRYAPQQFETDVDLTKENHVFALDWTPEYIRWYFDGRLIRHAANDYFHRPLHLKLDRESFPYWFGLPDKQNNNLPNTFDIHYVRSWRRVTCYNIRRQLTNPNRDYDVGHPGPEDLCSPPELSSIKPGTIHTEENTTEDTSDNNQNTVETKENVTESLENAGGLAIVAAMVNSEGSELENEWVTIGNFTGIDVNLSGWTLSDTIRPKKVLWGKLASGDTSRIAQLKVATKREGVLLNNRKGTLVLADPIGRIADTVSWTTRTRRIKEGVPVLFQPRAHAAETLHADVDSKPIDALNLRYKNATPAVRIVAALPNAPGDESGEWVCVLNLGTETVDLTGWALSDCTYRTPWPLEGSLLPGESWTGRGMRDLETGPCVQLSNKNGRIALIDHDGIEVHKVVYGAKKKVPEGEIVTFALENST